MKICINPGHGPRKDGSYDPGAVGPTGIQEAKQVLKIGEVVERKLKASGHDTLLIHDGDLFVVSNRANSWAADYFISIHRNAFTNRTANGISTFALAAGGMGEKMAKGIQAELLKAFKLRDRGVKFANFHVLRETKMPAVLTEIGFISNPAEERIFEDVNNVEKAAEAICIGFSKAVGVPYSSSKVAEKPIKNMVVCSGEVDKRAGLYLGDFLQCEVKLLGEVNNAQISSTTENVYVIGSTEKYATNTTNIVGADRYETARQTLELCRR